MNFATHKNVLVVVSHQDDEALFCGGLLSSLAATSELTVICMTEAKQPRHAERRNAWFREACQKVGARAVTTAFRDARHVWSHVDRFCRQRPAQIAAMRDFLRAQAESLRPDVVITHNEAGEYGHCYHKVLHRVCRQVFDRRSLYYIGAGARANGQAPVVVEYDPQKKRQLLDCYPSFDAATFTKRFFGSEITYRPETYLAAAGHEPPLTVSTGPRLLCELSRDFLHFWVRKLRADAGWY